MSVSFEKSSIFRSARDEKAPVLLQGLNNLSLLHHVRCPEYRRIVDAVFGEASLGAGELAHVPWLPVRLFKQLELSSVPRPAVVKTLLSSGTSGQAPSRIFLDQETARSQTLALISITTEFLGPTRRPMLIIDDKSFLQDRTKFNARAAAILGFAPLGRNHHYLLDAQMRPDWDALQAWIADQNGAPILLFGFTFIVWQSFVEAARAAGVMLRMPPGSALIHGGGWKRLEDKKVSNASFKQALADTFGIERVHNYYGMVEQVGSVFFECEHGKLHTPLYADVLIRDPITLEPVPNERDGVVQVFSLLPHSYPGHSLLTEDLGVIHGEDDCSCGRMGKYFAIHGRLKNAELRGCSDTRELPPS